MNNKNWSIFNYKNNLTQENWTKIIRVRKKKKKEEKREIEVKVITPVRWNKIWIHQYRGYGRNARNESEENRHWSFSPSHPHKAFAKHEALVHQHMVNNATKLRSLPGSSPAKPLPIQKIYSANTSPELWPWDCGSQHELSCHQGMIPRLLKHQPVRYIWQFVQPQALIMSRATNL